MTQKPAQRTRDARTILCLTVTAVVAAASGAYQPAAGAATLPTAAGQTHVAVVPQAPAKRLSPAVIAELLQVCAPGVHAETQVSVIATESSGDAWTLHDNTSRAEIHPATYAQAVRVANVLIGLGHSVDVGVAQINSLNFRGLGTTAEQMLDPCANLQVSSRMLAETYRIEYKALGSRPSMIDTALNRTLEVYNSGKSTGDDRYARAVRSQVATALVRQVMALALDPAQPLILASSIDAIPARNSTAAAPAASTSAQFVHVNILQSVPGNTDATATPGGLPARPTHGNANSYRLPIESPTSVNAHTKG